MTLKGFFISFAVGLMIGAAYALLRVKSPAPPMVALAGLLGILWGEELIERLLAPKQNSSLVGPPHEEQRQTLHPQTPSGGRGAHS
jgi:XapX domain-containing protein